MPTKWRCARTGCAFTADDSNTMDGHVRNVHGWRTPASVHTMPPKQCDISLPGLGRCRDTSGVAHGHWFKPGQYDPSLMLTEDEARDLVAYMQNQYLNRNKWPTVNAVLDRLEAHVKVTA